MRTRRPITLALLSMLALAACTGARSASAPRPAASPPAAEPVTPSVVDALTLVSQDGVSVIDGATGRLLSTVPGGIASADGSVVYSARRIGRSTAISTVEPFTGTTTSTSLVRGDLAIRAVSSTGDVVALMRPSPAGRWNPQGRTATSIVVVDPRVSRTDRFRLRGNFEPEAFASDGSSLYLLRYLPANAPTHYRVTRLDLASGKVSDVYGPDKVPVQNMTATRLVQALSPTGSALYTLYSNQPPAYATGYRPAQVDAGQAVAFIHTLDLANGFAMCVALPRVFGSASSNTSAIASSPDGANVFVIDARNGGIAVMDARRFRVTRIARMDLSALGSGPVSARVSSDGATLLVTGRAGMLTFDARTLALDETIRTPQPVTGLALSGDGDRLYLSWRGYLETLDASTLDAARIVPVPVTGSLTSVASFAG